MPSPNKAGWLLLAAGASLASCGTPDRPRAAGGRGRPVSDVPVKIGPPYQVRGRSYVPADDRRYDATGFASWYGQQHRGHATANGERFSPQAISAAHTTLPLPSYVEVTALDTGRTILVRINDRGPFADGRIIDLSQGAARLLGVERAGVSRVRVRRVDPSERDRAALRAGRAAGSRPSATPGQGAARPVSAQHRPAAAPILSSVPTSSFYVQVATLADADRADGLAGLLRVIGPAEAAAIGPAWRVRIGPYASEAEALSALARTHAAGYQDARIVRDSAPLTARSQEDR